MEKLPTLSEENEQTKNFLPIVPIDFGSGVKFPFNGPYHLALSVREGSAVLCTEDGEVTLKEGCSLYIRQGKTPTKMSVQKDFSCDYVLFSAAEEFLAHLELPDIACGGACEGQGISTVVKMSAYSLEYYHDCLKICASVYSFLASVARELMTDKLESFDSMSERLAPALLRINECYGEALTVAILANACQMSESAFSRAFKYVYGCAPIRYLIRIRIEAAKELLASTELSFEDIAVKCGFGTAKYFGDMLRKYEHITPRELRAMYRNMSQISFF